MYKMYKRAINNVSHCLLWKNNWYRQSQLLSMPNVPALTTTCVSHVERAFPALVYDHLVSAHAAHVIELSLGFTQLSNRKQHVTWTFFVIAFQLCACASQISHMHNSHTLHFHSLRFGPQCYTLIQQYAGPRAVITTRKNENTCKHGEVDSTPHYQCTEGYSHVLQTEL